MPDQPENTPAVAPGQQTVEAPNTQNRTEVYEKLYGQPPAQAAEPVAPAVAAPPAANSDALLQALIAEVQSLKASQAPPASVATPPAAPKPDWFNLLQDGKRTEAEQALIEKVSGGAKEQITRDAMAQALEVFTVNNEIERFNTQVKQDNPDLLDVEGLVGLQAEQYFRLGQFKNPREFTELYKQSVNKAVESIRTTLQRTRAVAKAEERVTRREVLNSYTPSPNQITSVARETQGSDPNQPAAPDVSLQSYMAMRQGNRVDNALPPDVRRQLNAQAMR